MENQISGGVVGGIWEDYIACAKSGDNSSNWFIICRCLEVTLRR